MYANFPYTLAVGSAEVPYLICQLLVFVPVSYFMIGFAHEASSFFFYCLVFLSAIAMFTWMGQLLVFLTPTQATAAILASGDSATDAGPATCLQPAALLMPAYHSRSRHAQHLCLVIYSSFIRCTLIVHGSVHSYYVSRFHSHGCHAHHEAATYRMLMMRCVAVCSPVHAVEFVSSKSALYAMQAQCQQHLSGCAACC